MRISGTFHFPSTFRLAAVGAALVLAGCAAKPVPLVSTDSGAYGTAAGRDSAAAARGAGAAGANAGAAGADGAAAGAQGSAKAGGAAGGAVEPSGASARAGGVDGAEDYVLAPDGTEDPVRAALERIYGRNWAGAGEDGDAASAALRRAEAAEARARRAEQEAAAAEERARRAEAAAAEAAQRLRRAEQDAAERARIAELEAAERERRGRVETAANSVLIGEDEKLQTLDGMLPAMLSMDEKGQFDFDSYVLGDEVKAQLDQIAAKLADAPYDRLHIVGFTDRIGADDYNQKLSEKRAWSVAGYLMEKGVPPYKLKVEGRGKTASLLSDEECKGLKRNALIECLQRDRRVEVVATVKEYNLKVQ